MKLLCTFLLLALSAWFAPSVHADDDTNCRKFVFAKYCLGGGTEALALSPVEGASNLFTDGEDQPHTQLEIVDDRIVAIERRVQPGGWREFDLWRKRLERVYRSGEDSSTFPRYAASRSSRLNAIRAGRGSARVDWQQEGWMLSLIWREPEAIHLRYAVSDLAGNSLSIDDL